MAVTGAERAEPQASELHDVFISYPVPTGRSSASSRTLSWPRGAEHPVDWQDIPPTAESMAEIEGAIDASDAIVYVLSPDSVSSRVCLRRSPMR